MSARYLKLSRSELKSRAQQSYEIYRECRVCPHACGMVDVYLPDLKYTDSAMAKGISIFMNTRNCPAMRCWKCTVRSVLWVYGMLVWLKADYWFDICCCPKAWQEPGRGCVLSPLSCPRECLWVWWAKYHLVHKVMSQLDREMTSEEYESAISIARELGFENLYLQSLKTAVHNLPDFDNTENSFPLDFNNNQENDKVGQL